MNFPNSFQINSLKTSILRKFVPIYFIRILKAVTEQSIKNIENEAFLLPFEIIYKYTYIHTYVYIFLFVEHSFLSKIPLAGPLWKQSRTDLLMLSLPF